ncbi:MAG: hypothetical protein HXY22_12890 [Alphaproteobacteria bacterium]|nr:hypothetical protein [Alphaproteobacteria bacterium]
MRRNLRILFVALGLVGAAGGGTYWFAFKAPVTAPVAQRAGEAAPQTRRAVRPVRTALAIDWTAARAEGATARYTASLQWRLMFRKPRLRRMRLPLVLPSRQGMMDRVDVYPRQDSYAASSREDRAVVEIFGSRIAGRVEKASFFPGIRRESQKGAFRIDRTDYGIDIVFNRFGAAYNISVICDDPGRDERCTNDDYAISLMNSIEVSAMADADIMGGAP